MKRAMAAWIALAAVVALTLVAPAAGGSTVTAAGESPTPAWSTMAAANVGIAPQLWSVSCPAADFCVAVGTFENGSTQQTLAEEWNGATWSTMATTDRGTSPILTGVSCTSPTFCVAVGMDVSLYEFHGNFGAYPPTGAAIAEEWNGSTWSTMTVAQPGTAQGFYGVSCASSTFCAAVGAVAGVAPMYGPLESLQEEWTGGGQWVWTPASNESGAQILNAVSCTSATFCMAVGDQQKGLLTDQWDGTAWSTAHPTSSYYPFDLRSISCTSATWCTGVGPATELTTGTIELLAGHWNGQAWSVGPIATPSSTIPASIGAGISCISPTDCVAAGAYQTDATSSFLTLSSMWNGSAWSGLPPADPSPYGDALNGVSCVSTGQCVAVGLADTPTGATRALAELYNPTCSIVSSRGGQNLVGADLVGCDLAGDDMAGDNLQHADLADATLTATDLAGANLQQAILDAVTATGADLAGSNLQDAALIDATLSSADFAGANLQQADLAGATLTGSPKTATDLNGANLESATLTGALCGTPNDITASGANTNGVKGLPPSCKPPL